MTLKKGPHREDIKAEIRKRGTTLCALSKAGERHVRTVANSLLRPIPSGNKLIASFLGLPLHHLWPSWYDQNDRRIFKPKSRRKSGGGHCKKAA